MILKPTGSFYFGGENSFGEAKSKGETDEDIRNNYFSKRSAYFAKSERFPQQTQVLGMLRKEIMRDSDCLKLHNSGEYIVKGKKEKAHTLIGANWKNDLGKIEKISPLFLEKNEVLFVPAPYDKSLKLVKTDGTSFINGRKSDKSYAFEVEKTEKNEMFGAKDHLCYDFISNQSILNLDDIFKSFTRIGNQTLQYTDDDEEQLYKMTAYRLKEDVAFVCFVTINEDMFDLENNTEYENIVELGGERSQFKLTITKQEQDPQYQAIYDAYGKEENRVVLISDCYVNDEIFSHVDIALSDKVSFRTINSDKHKFSKTSKCILLKKGSVFYPKENSMEAVCKMIEEEKAFSAIGYNQYIKIDKSKGQSHVR